MYNASQHLVCIRTGPGRDAFQLRLITPRSVDTTDTLRRLDSRGPAVAGLDTRRRTGDGLLRALGPGKISALGDLWDGIARRWDALVAGAQALPPGNSFALNVPLGAEGPGNVLDLGLFLDGLTTLEAQLEKAKAAAASNTNTTDAARVRAQIHPARTTGDFSKPKSIEDIQKLNDAEWAKRNSPTYNSGDETRERNAEKLRVIHDATLRLRPR